MNRNQKPTTNFQEARTGDCLPRASHSIPGLCVTVISTTTEGTTAALNEATRLATDLEAHITLLKLEVVPLRFPLERPPVSLDIATKKQCSLVLQSSAREAEVAVRVCLCHDRDLCLRQILRRRALVVIGGGRRWWKSSEERLEQTLRRLGHHVIFVDVDQRADRTSVNSFPVVLDGGTDQYHRQEESTESFFGSENLR
jgi:hypothetical protein